jgi:hypothetical protein
MRLVEHVNGDEVDAFFRKKLFRSEAAASPGLRVKNKFVGDGIHWKFQERRDVRLLPASPARQARERAPALGSAETNVIIIAS